MANLPPLINNVLTAPTPDTGLLQALANAAAGANAVNPVLTGAAQPAGLITNAQNTATSARSDALKTSQSLASLAMATAANLLGGQQDKPNPAAGSSALTALNGGGSSGGQQQGTQATQGAKGVSISINPSSATVAPGNTLPFTATVTGSSNTILNPIYYDKPTFYISDMGASFDPNIPGEIYQVDAVGYGGNANTVAVVESTYAVYTSSACRGCP